MQPNLSLKPLKGFNAFGEVHNKGRKVHSNDCTLIYTVNRTGELSEIKYGISVPKRNCKKAVIRNRIKRLLRESLRQLAPELEKRQMQEVLIYWRKIPKAANLISLKEVLESLEYTLSRIEKKNLE